MPSGCTDPSRSGTACFRWASRIGGSVSPVETGLHRDVAAQGFNLQLGVVQSLLDHVTDADEADKLTVIITGRWRTRPWVMMFMTLAMVSWQEQLRTSLVIRSLTFRVR